MAYENDRFTLSQDWELPIPGFFIVTPKRCIDTLSELTKEERDEMFEITDRTIKILRENNINPGEELEAFYVNEYYKACEQLYRSDEQKYYETFLQDYLEIVKTCDNLLIPYYNIPDSVKNNVADAKYSAFRSYNYYTNHSEHGIKSLFRQSGAADPERLNNYYMAQLKEHRRDTAYLNRAINVLNENNCSQTPAFYSYCEASYMINPTYMNCIGCAFASKEDGLRDDMINYFMGYDLRFKIFDIIP